jgi:CcmD family protein
MGGEPVGGGNEWILAVNLIIWTGLFLYLLRLGRKLRDMEKDR